MNRLTLKRLCNGKVKISTVLPQCIVNSDIQPLCRIYSKAQPATDRILQCGRTNVIQLVEYISNARESDHPQSPEQGEAVLHLGSKKMMIPVSVFRIATQKIITTRYRKI